MIKFGMLITSKQHTIYFTILQSDRLTQTLHKHYGEGGYNQYFDFQQMLFKFVPVLIKILNVYIC